MEPTSAVVDSFTPFAMSSRFDDMHQNDKMQSLHDNPKSQGLQLREKVRDGTLNITRKRLPAVSDTPPVPLNQLLENLQPSNSKENAAILERIRHFLYAESTADGIAAHVKMISRYNTVEILLKLLEPAIRPDISVDLMTFIQDIVLQIIHFISLPFSVFVFVLLSSISIVAGKVSYRKSRIRRWHSLSLFFPRPSERRTC
jgi:hypothetical protein